MASLKINLRQLLHYFLQIIGPLKKHLLCLFFLVILESVITVFWLPDALEWIFKEADKLPSLNRGFWGGVVCFFCLYILMEIVNRCQQYLFYVRIVPSARKCVIDFSVDQLLGKSYAFHQRKKAGEFSENVTRLADNVLEILDISCLQLLSFLSVFIFAIYRFWNFEARLGWLLMGFFLFMLVILYYFNFKVEGKAMHWAWYNSEVGGYMVDVLNNIFSVKFFGNKKHEKKKLEKLLGVYGRAERTLQKTFWTMLVLLGVGYLFVMIGLVTFGSQHVCEKKTPVGEVLGLLFINDSLMNLIWYDVTDLSMFTRYVGETKRILGDLCDDEEEENVVDHEEKKTLLIPEGHIVFRDVCFRFSPKLPLLFDGLTLEIPAKKKVGIVGCSGAGKTSFINLLLRLYEPESGSIMIDGQNIGEVSLLSLRRGIGFVSQDIELFHRSLAENIRYGRLDATREEVIEAARKACAHDFIMEKEGQYDTLVGEKGDSLSGGQRQKIAIARVILKNAPILIFDEATSHMDSITELELQQIFTEWIKDKTAIVVAHRLRNIMHMDWIFVLERGKVVEQGTHLSLLEQGGKYSEMWHIQQDTSGFLRLENQ